MKVDSIILTQFRNHQATHLGFNERVIGLCGSNGAGKTSILEAIHFLSVSKGMNAYSDGAYLMREKDFFRLEGSIKPGSMDSEGTHKLVVKYQARKGKIIEWNGDRVTKLGDLIGRFPVVSMVPQDIDLLLAGSRERRRIIDLAFAQIDREYLDQLILYRRILKQRNAYLKSVNKPGDFKPAMLSVFDDRIAPSAQFIFEKRKSYLKQLEKYFADFYEKVSSGKEKVDFSYKSELHEHDFQYLSEKNREKDRYTTRTNSGIHKDDLELMLYDSKLKDTASQGQLKSAVLSLKLAIWELIKEVTAKDPLFLLDDLFDRLDENRASSFLNLIKNQSDGQIFITDTNEERLKSTLEKMGIPFQIVVIENGEIVS